MRTALGIVWALAACGSSGDPPPPAPAPPAARLAALLEPLRARASLPALAAGVWRDGVPIAIAATGLRRAGDAAHPVTAADPWHLGSDTKAMTATLIGIYVDRGVLHWTDTLAQLFAGVPIDPGLASVTLDQLLQHRAGFAAKNTPALEGLLWHDGPTTRTDFVRALLAQPPAGTVGAFQYANASFIVAGAALERATGQTWEQLIQTELFAPLHMTSCGFGPPTGDAPWGHKDGVAIAPDAHGADNPRALGPAGTVHCTLGDWGAFLSLHAGVPQTLISAASLAHLHAPPPGGNYMGGWIIVRGRLTHDGSNTLWYCSAIVDPSTHVAVAWAANSAGSATPPIPQADLFVPLLALAK